MECPRLPLFDREVVHVRAKLFDRFSSGADSNYLKFAIDPNIITFETLHSLLSKSFDLQTDFAVSYLTLNNDGNEFYLPINCDWDLDAAIYTSSIPALRVVVNSEKNRNEWDFAAPTDACELTSSQHELNNDLLSSLSQPWMANTAKRLTTQTTTILSNFSQRLGKTVASLQRAMGLRGESDSDLGQFFTQPMTDNQFRQYLDGVGRVKGIEEFLWHCFSCCLEPSVRKVGWRLLLAICPPDSTGQERIRLYETRAREYAQLNVAWKEAYLAGRLSGQQLAILIAVAIDVVRTDRTNEYYVGEKNRPRVCQLFDLLVTYCLYHPSVGYNQGMSDLASPLLVVQSDEATAYTCFCALMHRLQVNFCCSSQKGLLISLQHLHDLVVYMDPELARFLRHHQLADMYFTQRWILLELKREFTFEECAAVFEVQWAAVRLVALGQAGGSPSAWSDLQLTESDLDLPGAGEAEASNYSMRDLGLINSLLPAAYAMQLPSKSSTSTSGQAPLEYEASSSVYRAPSLSPSTSVDCHDPIRLKDFVSRLPPPAELGNGNPFLLFLCLSLLLEYREHLLGSVREAGDLIIFYQRQRRRHNMQRILARAQAQFSRYLTARSWLPAPLNGAQVVPSPSGQTRAVPAFPHV